ncbi:unnamed protein product, partial [Rotaria sp. Silwood1]
AQADAGFGVWQRRTGGIIVTSRIGLWTYNLPENCRGSVLCNKIKAARAFFVIATMAAFVGAVLLIYIALKSYPKIIHLAALIAALISCLFGLIGWAIGMSALVGGFYKMGAASALGLIGWMFSLAATILAYLVEGNLSM